MHETQMFIDANQAFNQYVTQINDHQWLRRVPSTPKWTVRELLNHVTTNNMRLATLLEGNTPHIEGDILDGDPKSIWTQSAQRAEDAVAAGIDTSRRVTVPLGEIPVLFMIQVQTADRVIHGWDLARAIGADETIAPHLLQSTYDFCYHNLRGTNSPAFAPEISVSEDADLQTKLLALTGRDVGVTADDIQVSRGNIHGT